MDNLRNTSKLVKEALLRHPKARNSDNYLYYLICKAKLAGQGIDIDEISFSEGLLHKNDLLLPAFETVRRARQKVQEKHPELAGNAEVEAMRVIKEGQFRDFARKGLL
jgi:hypothetical protein